MGNLESVDSRQSEASVWRVAQCGSGANDALL